MPTPNRILRGQAVPLAALVFSTSKTCPIPPGYVGHWFDGATLFQRNADGTDSVVQALGGEDVIYIAGAQPADAHARTTRYDLATAGDNVTSTLGDGAQLGQRKTLAIGSALAGKTAVITPAQFADGTTITLTARFDAVELEWQLAGWTVVGVFGTASVA